MFLIYKHAVAWSHLPRSVMIMEVDKAVVTPYPLSCLWPILA